MRPSSKFLYCATGILRQPRGQKTVLYTVPEKPENISKTSLETHDDDHDVSS